MNTPNETPIPTLKLKRALTRKQFPSKLDPYTDQLLQMDAEKKTLQEMIEWLKTQNIETADSTVSDFLVRRRGMQRWDGEKNLMDGFRVWLKENPDATAEMVIERFKMLALSLSLQAEAGPEVLMLADRLAGTASRVANDRSRADYRARKLVMEEDDHEEAKKTTQAKALELCLSEAKKFPAVDALFRSAFAALDKAEGITE